MAKSDNCACCEPPSRREISTKSDNNASTTFNESSIWLANCFSSCPWTFFLSIEVNKLNALNGCIKSWLAAAKKRVLLRLAASASALAFCNSSVRLSTRFSRVSLACCNAFSASICAVISVNVLTKPPPGIACPLISNTVPSGITRSIWWLLPARICSILFAIDCSFSSPVMIPRSTL